MRSLEQMTPAPLPINIPMALLNMWRLTRNKEDTRLVFETVKHVAGGSFLGSFQNWVGSDYGQKIIADPDAALRVMSDRERLRMLPVGSFGRTYADFMDRENLDTNGVYEAAVEAGMDMTEVKDAYPEFQAYRCLTMLTHDLYHVLSGFNRDGLGEAAVLKFTAGQNGERGAAFIAFFAGLKVRLERPSIPVGKILRNAKRMGLDAARLAETDLPALFELPLDEVRKQLNITPCATYASIPKDVLDTIALPQAA